LDPWKKIKDKKGICILTHDDQQGKLTEGEKKSRNYALSIRKLLSLTQSKPPLSIRKGRCRCWDSNLTGAVID
jgi:hypothetical protein